MYACTLYVCMYIGTLDRLTEYSDFITQLKINLGLFYEICQNILGLSITVIVLFIFKQYNFFPLNTQ